MMELQQELRSRLARVRRRWFAQVALRTVGGAAFAASVPVLAAVAADRLIAPDGVLLVALASLAAIAATVAAGVVVFRMQRRPDDRHVARFVEEQVARTADAHLDDELVSGVEMADRGTDAGPFAGPVIKRALERLRTIEPSAVVLSDGLRRAALTAAGGALAIAAALTLGAPGLLRAVETARVRLFPAQIHVSVHPGHAGVVAGQPLTIRATITGAGTLLERTPPSLVVSAGGDQRTVPMVPAAEDANTFAFAFESVDRTFSYHVVAASAKSSPFTVTALFPPRIDRIDVRYEYPAFTGLKPREEEDGGDIYGPAGTKVTLRIFTDKPVTSGELALAQGASLSLRMASVKTLETDMVLSRDGAYRVRLVDVDGLRSAGDVEYFIRLMDDRPPDVHIVKPSADQSITPLEEVAIEARADDDYGISAFDLVYSVAGRGGERSVPFRAVSTDGVAKTGTYLIAAEDLKVQPGDVITYYARARDVGRGKRPTEARSDIFFLEVKPFGEEFIAATSQAMGGGAGTQIESLIAAQKEIINATWNLERRAQAGRSAADIEAVAQAQAELKARAEHLAATARRGGRPPYLPQSMQTAPPWRAPRRGTADPVAAAIEAMGRAIEQLQGQRTKDAIAHEMAALQGLVAAEAEIRRRQVAQQNASNGGGGGSNRQSQDLSALFDKELQRQQRTNYETRSQIEERPDRRNETSALDRIRDLARRQEELNKRQRELAENGLSAEELKRQLERLTREQMELRQQAEALAKEMASRGSQGSTGSQGSAGASSMQQAADQMKSAASDLRRQDASGAAASGDKAAEQLRRLEQQMRGGTADARQRAAAELKLEAQQIAGTQRQIASETERLQQQAGNPGRAGETQGTGDAMRRLAAEKDKLADRVDELQRAAQQLGRDGQANGNAAAREAARELEQGQVGTRMRDTAKQLRAAAGGHAAADPKQAETEQQLARALDKVVGTLGGGSDTELGRLSEQLDRTREIRDKLNRLEQQIRDLERKQAAAGRGQGKPSDSGRQGRQGQQGDSGSGTELDRLRQEYARELQRTRESLDGMQAERAGAGGATPEQHQWSTSAPGTEAFKQDRSGWESLRKDVDQALERYEAGVSERLAKRLSEDRLSAGGSDRVPDAYRPLVSRYYQSLAKVKK
jgi:hypothetical protein